MKIMFSNWVCCQNEHISWHSQFIWDSDRKKKKAKNSRLLLACAESAFISTFLAFLSTLPTTVNYSRLKHSKTILQERRWWVKHKKKDRIEWWWKAPYAWHPTLPVDFVRLGLWAETFCNSEAFWLQGFSQASWGAGAIRKCRDKNIAISKGKQQSTNRKSPWKLKSFGKSTETCKNIWRNIYHIL